MQTNSYHIFMFPFSLESEWDAASIDKMLKGASWERKQFAYSEGDFASNFSEQGYFYEFSSGAVFDDPDSLNRILATYRLRTEEGDTFTININKRGNKKSYTLNVEKIELNIYDDKAAILSFHLRNSRYTDIKDILFINDYGRRIYPQYLANGDDGDVDLQKTKDSFLADSISLALSSRPLLSEDFSSYAQKSLPPYRLPGFIKGLLPKEMHDCRWLLDDRMFVVSYFLNADFANRMKKEYGKDGKWLDPNRVELDWYQYVFVDNGGPTCQNNEMFKDLLEHATYKRWSEYGTFFGITRYSFTVLMNEENFVLNHIKTMYYRMTSLVLAQRVLSLYYSREISEISKELDENKLTNKELRARVNTLNRDYLRFVNNVYFREVTPQDQGIELYDLLQDQMNIKRDEEGLSTEVEQLYHYITMTNDEQRNEEAEKLSFIATLFLVPTLISGIWGMNIGEAPLSYVIYAIVTTSVLAAIFILFQKFKRNR